MLNLVVYIVTTGYYSVKEGVSASCVTMVLHSKIHHTDIPPLLILHCVIYLINKSPRSHSRQNTLVSSSTSTTASCLLAPTCGRNTQVLIAVLQIRISVTTSRQISPETNIAPLCEEI